MSSTRAAARRHYGDGLVRYEDRSGKKRLCPHCGHHLEDGDIYTDRKGWMFCRACFRKGKGAVCIGQPADRGTEKEEDKLASAGPPFVFEYELDYDPEEYDLPSLDGEGGGAEKEAGVSSQVVPTGRQPSLTATSYNATSPSHSVQKAVATQGQVLGMERAREHPDEEEAAASFLSSPHLPNVLLPALGAAGGAALEPREGRLAGLLKGLMVGGGAAAGQSVGGHLSGNDTGARILGGLGGGTLGYLLSRALSSSSRGREGEEDE